jgi:ABC-type transport system substrate-binding protein
MRVSSDGLTYLFRLREGLRWSDGEPVEADDFIFAWESVRDEGAITAFLMEDMESFEALDARTIEVRLREPRSYFPYILASTWAFPRPKHRCEELGEDWRKPENLVTNGPFMLDEYSSEGATLVANPYWSGPRGNVKEISIAFTSKSHNVLDEWMAGKHDVVQVLDPRGRTAPDTESDLVPELSFTYVGFRPDTAPFSSELVRKAFSHAIDREAVRPERLGLLTAATRGGAIPPAMPGHSHKVSPSFDPELARRLLADAGYPDGKGLPELTLVSSPRDELADRLAESWNEILGARVSVRYSEGHLWAADLGDAQLWLSGWTADYPDPDGFFRGLFKASGWPFYRDEDIEGILEKARSLQDQNERMRLYHELDRLWVAERAAILPLFYGRTLLVRRPWVQGVWATPLTRVQLDEAVILPHEESTPSATPAEEAAEAAAAP